ncbi:tape measure protein [Salmonella enterica subsp. enterica]|nr:tape measure protein [Salmonella enterica subsp. enterica]
MSEKKDDELVTTIKAIPDLTGLQLFQREVAACEIAVRRLDHAIKSVNRARPPVSPYSPRAQRVAPVAGGAGVAPVLATGAGLALIQGASQGTTRHPLTGQRGGGGTGLTIYGGGRGGAGGSSGLFGGDGFGWQPGTEFGDPWSGEAKKARQKKSGEKNSKFSGVDKAMGAAGVVTTIAMGMMKIADSMDNINTQINQLQRLPQTLGDARKELLDLNKAASDVRGDYSSFTSAYTNMATATAKKKFSKAELVKATQGLTGSLALGGAGEQAKSNALYQMGQAFSSDRFAGDEFRSFMEAIGTQANAVAAAFGTDVKGLRKMSEEGKLTAETVVRAFAKLGDNVKDQIKKTGWTWGQLTTVMANDWNAMLIDMTSGDDWKKLTQWLADNLLPKIQAAEQWFARFWRTTTDQSKANLLIGILAALGAAFTALAIPVLAATWPFLAIGAAVWLVFEVFNDFISWLDGKGGNIFSSLFGSFAEFEKKYPNIIAAFKKIRDIIADVWGMAEKAAKAVSDFFSDDDESQEGETILSRLNPLKFVDAGLGMALGNVPTGKQQTTNNVNNSYQPQINVNSTEEAKSVLDSTYSNFVGANTLPGINVAETAGAVTD